MNCEYCEIQKQSSIGVVQIFIYEIILRLRSKSLKTWKYIIRRNVNSDFSVVTMRRIAIICFELGVVKNFMQNFNRKAFQDYFFI